MIAHPFWALAFWAAAASASPDAGLTASVDARVELIAAIDMLAGEGGTKEFDPESSPYGRALLEAMKPHAGDHAVESYRRLVAEGLVADTALEAAYAGLAPNSLEPLNELPHIDSRFQRPEKKAKLLAFLREASALAHHSPLRRTLDLHARELDEARQALLKAARKRNFRGEVAAYTRLKLDTRLHFILCPTFKTIGGLSKTTNGTQSVIQMVGLPVLGAAAEGYGRLAPDSYQEYGHGALDSAAKAHEARIAALEPKLSKRYDTRLCGFWLNCVSEYVVRGLSARLSRRAHVTGAGGDAEAAPIHPAALRVERRLLEYEAAPKGKYPTLAEFYPRLLDALEEP